MTGQLSLVEARRLLRNPYLWTVTVGTVALLGWSLRNQLPNVAEVTTTAAMATFLTTGTLMVIANLATLRDQREGVPEALAALPGRPEVRTRAVLLATGWVGAALAAAVIGGHLSIRLLQGGPAAGLIDVGEILAALLAAAVMAASGVALGRWAPSPIGAPAALGVLVVGLFVGGLFLVAWHLPITAPYEMQVFGRPSWPRVLYLAAALVLLAALAMLRHGWRPLRLGIAATALATLIPAAGWIAVTAPILSSTVEIPGQPLAGEPALACVEREAVTYCHFPGFTAWVPVWARAAEPVAAALPPQARPRIPTVTQTTSFGPIPSAGEGKVLVRMTWGRGAAGVADRAGLAGQIAGLVTGLTDPNHTYDFGGPFWCDGRGQARTVVTLWLAGQVAPLRPAVRSEDFHGRYVEVSTFGDVGYGEREVGYAQALLDRPDARELIWAHWERLLDPDTTIDDALPLLGLPDRFPAEPLNGTPCD